MCLRSAPWSGLMTLEPLVVAVATGVSSFASFRGAARRLPYGRVDSSTSYFQQPTYTDPPMKLRFALPIATTAALLALVGLTGIAVPVAPGSECGGGTVTIAGTDGDDTLEGTRKPDVIEAGGGDDTIESLGGNDA